MQYRSSSIMRARSRAPVPRCARGRLSSSSLSGAYPRGGVSLEVGIAPDTIPPVGISTTTGTIDRIELPIQGMSCAACASRVEKELNKLDGVTASVNYATERATVAFDRAHASPDTLVAAVEQAGYAARLPQAEVVEEADPSAPLRRRLVVSAALSLPVLLLAMVPALQFTYWQWLSLALATPVVFWGGWPFHVAAWKSLRHGTATMDTLISLGTLAAWSWSIVALVFLDAAQPA